MKIHAFRPAGQSAPKTERTKKSRQAESSFQALLHGKVEKTGRIRALGRKRRRAPRREHATEIIEKAVGLLDSAMAEIRTHGAPRQDTVHSLQELRDRLAANAEPGGESGSIGAILAAEASRLREW